MPATALTFLAQTFEAAMLICFGASWPLAILKTLRTRRTEGKSLAFLVMIFAGYLAGMTAKCVRAATAGAWPEWVTALYALNGAMVVVEIGLYLKFRPK